MENKLVITPTSEKTQGRQLTKPQVTFRNFVFAQDRLQDDPPQCTPERLARGRLIEMLIDIAFYQSRPTLEFANEFELCGLAWLYRDLYPASWWSNVSIDELLNAVLSLWDDYQTAVGADLFTNACRDE